MCRGISGIGDWFFLCLHKLGMSLDPYTVVKQDMVYLIQTKNLAVVIKVNGIFDMKTISFKDLIELGVEFVTVVMTGYQTKGIFSHWEPFNRDGKVKFQMKLYKGACYSLENQSFVLGYQESEVYSMDEEGKVFLYYPESIRES